MKIHDSVVAVYDDHAAAEDAVRKLIANGFATNDISLVGMGYHTEERIVGFYNSGDRIRFWGARGAFWGGLWGLFVSGAFLSIPMIGPVVVLGYLAAKAICVIEGAIAAGGLSALGAALFSIGIPKDNIVRYESALRAEGFLVMAHGPAAEIARAKTILAAVGPSRLDMFAGMKRSGPMLPLHLTLR